MPTIAINLVGDNLNVVELVKVLRDYKIERYSVEIAEQMVSWLQGVAGQNGSGQNGTDKMVWTKWYRDKMVLDKMVWTKWYGQNGTILYFVYILIQLNSIMFSNQKSQINDKHIVES